MKITARAISIALVAVIFFVLFLRIEQAGYNQTILR